jgi:hypothetical protein
MRTGVSAVRRPAELLDKQSRIRNNAIKWVGSVMAADKIFEYCHRITLGSL